MTKGANSLFSTKIPGNKRDVFHSDNIVDIFNLLTLFPGIILHTCFFVTFILTALFVNSIF